MISTCILVKDEMGLLIECINNIGFFSDEIIIVNNSDKAIPKENLPFKDKIFIYQNYDLEMDRARNIYVKMATKKWIFVIDVDERISYDTVDCFLETLKNADNSIMGFLLPRYDYFGGGMWALIPILRVFRNIPEIYYNDVAIHATVMDSIKQINGIVDYINFSIHHLDIIRDNDYQLRKRAFYTRILEEGIQKDCENFRFHRFLGLEYAAQRKYKKAEDCFINADKILPHGDNLSLLFLAQMFIQCGKLKQSNEIILHLKNKLDYYDERICFLEAELAVKNSEWEFAKYVCLEMQNQKPFDLHNIINTEALNYIMYGKINDKLSEILIEKNEFLKLPMIYRPVIEPNIFRQQSLLLSCSDVIINKMRALVT